MAHTRLDALLRTTFGLAAVLLIGGFGLTGCASNPSKSTSLMRKGEATEITAAELRIRVRALAGPFSGMVENAADEVMAATTDPAMQRMALRWKIDAIPTFQAAIFQPDPMAALLDVWTLIAQIQNSIASGPASALPAEITAPVSQTMSQMEGELVKIAGLLGPEGTIERFEAAADKWAADHPIDSGLRTRSPTTSELASITASAKVGIRRSISTLTEGMGDMATRIDVYTAYLPKQARWQAEYLIGDVVGDSGDLGGVIGSFSELTAAVDTIATTVDELPETVTTERLAVFEQIQQERLAVLEAISQDMQTVFDFATQEGVAAVSDLVREERIAVLQAVTAERVAAFESLREERIATMAQIEEMVPELVESSVDKAIDHVFLRLAQLLVVLLVVLAVGAFLFARSIRRGRATG